MMSYLREASGLPSKVNQLCCSDHISCSGSMVASDCSLVGLPAGWESASKPSCTAPVADTAQGLKGTG